MPAAQCAEPATSPSASSKPATEQTHHASVDSGVYPWSSLVKVFNSIGGACTGAVIARDRILTAGHCVYAFRTHRFLPPDALHVLQGYDRGDYRTHARVVRYRLGPGYDPENERLTAVSDWVVLDLAEPLPSDVRPLTLAPASAAPDRKVILAGFAQDRAYVLTADEACRITGTQETGGLISHDCLVEPGDSGAPLLQRGTPTVGVSIVGIVVGVSHGDHGSVGIAAPVPPDLLPKDSGIPGATR